MRNLSVHSISIIKNARHFGPSLTTFFFSREFLKKSPHFTENVSVSDQLIHEDGRVDRRTEMTKLIGAFCDYTTAPKSTLQIFC